MIKLKEFGAYKKLNSINSNEFRAYLNQCWKKRYFLYDDSDIYNNEEGDKEQKFLTFDGDYIKARNYVGFINFNGESVTVYPKIFTNEIKEEDVDKFLITNLMYWLRGSSRIKFPIIDIDLEFNKEESFLEILIYIFSKITLDAVYSSPYFSYEEVEEELSYLKGRINIKEYFKNNISTGRWNSFNVVHEPFIYNNKVNKIIKFVARKLYSVSKNKKSIINLEKILFILEDIDDIIFGESACNNININRFNKEYENVISLCELFLKNSSITLGKNNDKLNFCFLLPMELIFEDFIYNFIKENYNCNFKEIIRQKSNLYLADLYLNENHSGKLFNLKMDIYLKDNCSNEYILDTKYKVINSNKLEHYGISQSDMYQMCSYALRGGCNKLALIYPKTFELEEEIKLVINNKLNFTDIEIDILNFNFLLDFSDYIKGENIKNLYLKNDKLLRLDIEKYFSLTI
ncbi:hypothetical protein [Clostridium tertium]|uniref:5-methylcytosine-specific restriction enzyme subunit McrC n=1 Tax=Clostridium tertium TaxID=1559 RepID=A0A6N2YMU7_9CLOT